MVTTLQVVRGGMRTFRAINRAAKRAERQRIANQIALDKVATREAALEAVKKYQDVIEALTGAHRISFQRRDWVTIASSPKIAEPQRTSSEEKAATAAFAQFSPGLLARTFGLDKKKRTALANNIEAARRADEDTYNVRKKEAESRNAEIEFAQKLLDLDCTAIECCLNQYSCLSKLPFSTEGVSVVFANENRIIAMADGLETEDMPTQSLELLKSGKLSAKPYSKTRLLDLHRDNIFSAAVRVATEFLQCLPIDFVEVVMNTDMRDRGSGHLSGEPVLYLRVTAQALSSVNLLQADPTPLVERLGGHFDWNKRSGFQAINLKLFDVPIIQLEEK